MNPVLLYLMPISSYKMTGGLPRHCCCSCYCCCVRNEGRRTTVYCFVYLVRCVYGQLGEPFQRLGTLLYRRRAGPTGNEVDFFHGRSKKAHTNAMNEAQGRGEGRRNFSCAGRPLGFKPNSSFGRRGRGWGVEAHKVVSVEQGV